MPSLEIRTLGADDWATWREVRLRALTDAPFAFGSRLADWQGDNDREDRWRERFDTVELNAVAVSDGQVIGTVGGMRRCDGSEESVELISMWVAPGCRGLGVGEALIDAVIDWAMLESIDVVVLCVRRGNRPAAALYERMGFRLLGPNPDDEAEDLMSRDVIAGSAD